MFTKEISSTFEKNLKNEWLLTNGIGGYASSTLIGVNTRTSKDKIATIYITLEVQDIEQLNQVIKQIRKVDSVYEVTRKK